MEGNASIEKPKKVLLIAFQGWSDAGAAATTAAKHLISVSGVKKMQIIDSAAYTDMQMHRPEVKINDDGIRVTEWPDTTLFGPDPNATADLGENIDKIRPVHNGLLPELFILDATEPAFFWKNYVGEIVDLIDTWEFDLIVSLGSMFSDAPHSRPIPITVTSEHASSRQEFEAEKSDYEGPVGISSIIHSELTAEGIPNLAIWAQVPHYVHSSPSPKATLAILDRLEDILNVVIPRGTLLAEANEWEENINNLASQDEEMTNYIERLEDVRDSVDGQAATGEAIAYELENFLRKRPNKDDEGN